MRTCLLALVASLLIAAPAYADSSSITTPSDGTFPVIDGAPGTITVAGTASGPSSVDIICTYRSNNSKTVATSVPVSGGSFSTTVDLTNVAGLACRLRAVPHGVMPADLEPYAGPRIGVDVKEVTTIPGGWQDFELDMAPLGGYALLQSLGDCGVSVTAANDPATLDFSNAVFDCGDSLFGFDDSDTRSEVQVDGANAYFAGDLFTNNLPYPPDPLPTLSVDPATGLGSVSSQQTLTKCSPGGAYPHNSTNCTDDVPVGVRVDHSGTALEDGALMSTADTFVSVDGQPHDVDLLYYTSNNSSTGTWRFPGETSFSSHDAGNQLTGFPAGPGAATLNQDGTAYGVFAWGTPPDKVTFGGPNFFEAHYLVHVPASGSSTIRFAYGTTFTLDQAGALTPAALAAVTPPPQAAPPSAPNAPVTLTPRAKGASFHRLKIGKNGMVTVFVNVPGAGSLSALETAVVARSAKTKKLTVSRVSKKVTKAGTVKLVLKLNKKGTRILRTKHRLRTTLAVTFKPATGSGNKLTRHLTLKLKPHHHG